MNRLSCETLILALPDPVWVRDLSGVLLSCNPAFEGFFGVDRSARVGTSELCFLSVEQQSVLRQVEQAVAISGNPWRHELTVPGTSGKGARAVDIALSPLRDDDGEVWAVLLAGRDVTALHQAALVARESERRLHQVFEEVDAVSVQGYDRHRRVIYWNPASEALYGYSREQALGRQLEDLIIPDFMRGAVVAAVDAWVNGGARIPASELTLRRADGSPVHVFSSHVMLHGVDREPQMYCVDVDLRERKAADERINKLLLAVEQSPESIVITDLSGRIEYVNEAFSRNSGYRREEVIGENPRILNSGKTPAATIRSLWDTLLRGDTWDGEFINRRKDGREYIEWAVISPIRQPDGRITHYVAVKEDVTEKRQLAGELERYRSHLEDLVAERTAQLTEARERAEAASHAKSSFLANMSHEIRTPMNAILGFAHILGRDLSSERQLETLSKIEGAASHLLSLVNDILDLSKIEAGKLNLQNAEFRMADLLDQVVALVQSQISQKGLTFQCICDDLPPLLQGDCTRLRQALLNYLGNAVKFTREGVVALRVSLLEARETELLVRFEVEDTGIGIEAKDLERLFQPFVQVDSSSVRRYSGTGLGLVITQRLANLMGGETGAESEMGRGSRFWFTARLGVASAESPSRMPKASDPEYAETLLAARHVGAKVLMAEDNLINQEVIRELLSFVNLEVDVADNGRAVVEMALGGLYDLILTDIQMPEMDGLEVARTLRASKDWRQVPILAMTANAFDDDRIRCLKAGMDDHLSKPVEPRRLYASLLRWLSISRPESQWSTDPSENDGLGESGPFELLLTRLGSLPGVDVDFALQNLNGGPDLYRRVLRKYAQHHADDVRLLRQHLAAGEWSRAHHLAHTLKGLAGTLGFIKLQGLVSELVTGLRNQSSLARLEMPLSAAELAQAELVGVIRGDTAELSASSFGH